jgi:hypothetical protein
MPLQHKLMLMQPQMLDLSKLLENLEEAAAVEEVARVGLVIATLETQDAVVVERI